MLRLTMLITAGAIERLALALWLGGFVVVGAVVAPLAFGVLSRPEAGELMGACFRRLNGIGVACGVILLVTLAVEAAADAAGSRRLLAARGALIGAALAVALYLGVSLFPRMEVARAAAPAGAAGPAFDRMHERSRQLLSLQMLLLVGVAVASAAARTPVGGRSAASRGEAPPGSGLEAPGEGRTASSREREGAKVERDTASVSCSSPVRAFATKTLTFVVHRAPSAQRPAPGAQRP